jgi:hypothetical protein
MVTRPFQTRSNHFQSNQFLLWNAGGNVDDTAEEVDDRSLAHACQFYKISKHA